MIRAFGRLTRHGRFFLGLLAIAVLAASAYAATDPAKFVKLLARRDPGARIGGNTIIATGKGERVYVVPDRPNFVFALGAGETIHGAAKGDQLGALGTGVRIIAPKRGHALIDGGPQGTIVVAGKGHDIVVEHKAGATIEVHSPDDEVVAGGPRDRVLCSGHVRGETIAIGRTDTAAAGCRGHGDTIQSSSVSHGALAHAAAVTGSGTNESPYVATNCSVVYSDGVCQFAFPQRTLTGFWANEYVPAYRCNNSYPYLFRRAYDDLQLLPLGVLVRQTNGSDIGVNISGIDTINRYAVGTLTGYPYSSVTNWLAGTSTYWVELYCTTNPYNGYIPPN